MSAPASAQRAIPLLQLDGLVVGGPHGRVFGPLDLTLDSGRLGVILGPAGSGRSALLLACSGRLGFSAGGGRLGRLDLRTQARGVRERVAVSRIAGLVDLEPQLTVGESLVERSLTEGVSATAAERAVAKAEADWSCGWPRDVLVADLSALDRARLTLALARVRPADLIVFDDVDHDLDPADQRLLYASIADCCASGTAVLASTTDPHPVPPHTVVVNLRPTDEDR